MASITHNDWRSVMDEARTDSPGPADAAASAHLTVAVSGTFHTLRRGDDAVTIGREPPSQILLSEPGISRTHVRIESEGDHWTLTDTGSRNGTFLVGERVEHVVITGTVTVHLGDPNGVALHLDPQSEEMPPGEGVGDTTAPGAPPSGDPLARVGAAVRGRREELGLSAHTLAEEVMTPEDYASFEGGQLWPESDAQGLLEQRLLWPAGVIAAMRDGADMPEEELTDLLSPTVQVAVVVDAAAVEVRAIRARVARLPDPGDRRFARDVTQLLTQLRHLDHLASAAARQAPGRPEVAVALASVRHARGGLLIRATGSPWVTLGQRLGAIRYLARLSIAEVATAVGVASAAVEALEREDQPPAPVIAAIEEFVTTVERHL